MSYVMQIVGPPLGFLHDHLVEVVVVVCLVSPFIGHRVTR
jgi:hypothetical protein